MKYTYNHNLDYWIHTCRDLSLEYIYTDINRRHWGAGCRGINVLDCSLASSSAPEFSLPPHSSAPNANILTHRLAQVNVNPTNFCADVLLLVVLACQPLFLHPCSSAPALSSLPCSSHGWAGKNLCPARFFETVLCANARVHMHFLRRVWCTFQQVLLAPCMCRCVRKTVVVNISVHICLHAPCRMCICAHVCAVCSFSVEERGWGGKASLWKHLLLGVGDYFWQKEG